MHVDAHQHFWQYTDEEFGWINDSMAIIRRDFFPADLLPLLDEAEIAATVAVQCCQSVAETEWLLMLADAQPRIAGVVGWVPLVDSDVEQTIERLSANPKLKGVRHILQAEPDEYMAREDFHAGITLLQQYSLTYDVLILERQLPAAIRFVDRHPDQPFVLDHIAKPLRDVLMSSASCPAWSPKPTSADGLSKTYGHMQRQRWRPSARSDCSLVQIGLSAP